MPDTSLRRKSQIYSENICLLKSQTKSNETALSFFCLSQRRTQCVSESKIYLISIIYFAFIRPPRFMYGMWQNKSADRSAKPLKFFIINIAANFKQISDHNLGSKTEAVHWIFKSQSKFTSLLSTQRQETINCGYRWEFL